MTTTPTIWKPEFFPNFQGTAGDQRVPQTIGLANGNILVVWEDDTFGSGPGRDIVGRIFTPEGNPAGPQFQVNSVLVNDNETGPKIVALPDGGFVVAYGGFVDALGGLIGVERFNSTGGSASSRFITDDRNSLTEWEITADEHGNYIVTFEREVEHVDSGDTFFSQDVQMIIYNNLSNNPLPERSAAQNTFDSADELGGAAAISGGNVITVYNEEDEDFTDTFETVEYEIIESGTGNVVVQPVHVAGSDDDLTGALAEGVAVLSGGQFVALYRYNFGGSIAMRIGAGDTPGSALGAEIIVAGGGHVVFDSQVIALRDGGFLVAWYDGTENAVLGTRYTVGGAVVGEASFEIAAGQFADLGELALTSDGRVLVTFTNSAGEISEVILDPRDNVIHGTAAGEVLTTQVGGTNLFGEGGDDLLLGQAGADLLDGGVGTDTLRGGGGDDRYVLRDVHRIDPSDPFSKFVFDNVFEAAGGGTDTVFVQRSGNISSYTLGANVENGIVAGTEAFNLSGNGLANRLTGNAAANALTGGAGDDLLEGGAGADVLRGGTADDTYVLKDVHRADPSDPFSKFVYDTVVEAAAEGTDTVLVQRVGNFSGYRLGANVENGLIEGGQAFDLTGTGGANRLTGNAAANRLAGRGGEDVLSGGLGTDVLDGGARDDVLAGGSGPDTFVFAPGTGRDLVRDFFDNGGGQDDIIDVAAYGFASIAAIGISASGQNAVLALGGGDTVTLRNYLADHALTDLGTDDFAFS